MIRFVFSKRIFVLFAFVFLANCSYFTASNATMPMGATPLTAIAAADVATVIGSKKTIGDHVVSYMKNMDCSSVRAEQGDYYCKPKQMPPPPQPKSYCYQSLGGATCYDRENPYGYDRRVGSTYTDAY